MGFVSISIHPSRFNAQHLPGGLEQRDAGDGRKGHPLGGSSGDLWDFLGRKQQNLWRFYGNLMEYTHTCVCIYIYIHTQLCIYNYIYTYVCVMLI